MNPTKRGQALAASAERWAETAESRAAIAYTEGVYESPDADGRPFGDAGVAAALAGHLDQTPRQLADRVRAALPPTAAKDDRTVVVLRPSLP